MQYLILLFSVIWLQSTIPASASGGVVPEVKFPRIVSGDGAEAGVIVNHLANVINKHASEIKYGSAATDVSAKPPSSAGGFVTLNSFSKTLSALEGCDPSDAFFYSGISAGQCIGDITGSGNSYMFGCGGGNATMSTYNGADCNSLISTATYTDVNTCNPYAGDDHENSLLYYQVTCSENNTIPVPNDTILGTIYPDSTCDASDLLGYIGITGISCINLLELCEVAEDYPSLTQPCDDFIDTGIDYSIKFGCASNLPSVTVFAGSSSCDSPFTQQEPLPTDCTVADDVSNEASFQFMCQHDFTDDYADDDSSPTSSSGLTASQRNAVIGGVVGGVAAVSVIGYVAYTKIFAAGADAATKKSTLASQGTLGNDL